MPEITVGLGRRSYPILIRKGQLGKIGADLAGRNFAKRYIIVADDRVADLFGAQLRGSLAAAGLDSDLISFPRGESHKHLGTIAELAGSLARLGVDRKDALIALGGGVTGDITGFLAASYMRGIPFIQVPTTLLAQVDSSVGGKTGVDIPEGKNLVGAFYQPKCVYIDSLVLKTLPGKELLNGLAEIIKYGVVRDGDFFGELEKNREAVLALNLPVLERIIARCCAIKAEVVAADERESDLRRILNYGHTIGHAVEAASGYNLDHGLAVAIGMVAANELAVGKGLLAGESAARIRELLVGYGLPVGIPPEYDRGRIKEYLKTDKKSVGGQPFFVLPVEIGRVIVTDQVEEELLDRVIGVV
ncbi:MAG: 3-dehydroquinate synthase [Desulfobulbales bacterium]|nr:3-dehydroquinate synthase [Desulfobulbales bacterium]